MAQRVMTKTTKGSPDGIRVQEYLEGQQYNLPEDLANAFDSMRVCRMPDREPFKNAGAAPENKVVFTPDDKGIDDVEENEDADDDQEDAEEDEDEKQSGGRKLAKPRRRK